MMVFVNATLTYLNSRNVKKKRLGRNIISSADFIHQCMNVPSFCSIPPITTRTQILRAAGNRVSLASPGKCQNSTFNQATIASFHILTNSLITLLLDDVQDQYELLTAWLNKPQTLICSFHFIGQYVKNSTQSRQHYCQLLARMRAIIRLHERPLVGKVINIMPTLLSHSFNEIVPR